MSSCSANSVATWVGIIQEASTANVQLEHQGRQCRQAHECLEKLLQALRMRTARLNADQRMLRCMFDKVKVARNRSSASVLSPDMFPQWQRQDVPHSWTVSEDEIEVVMQELTDVLASFTATSGCHDTWRRLGPILAKLPAPKPEIISGPERMPWPHLQMSEKDGMAAPEMIPQPKMAMRARLVPAPEFRCGPMDARLPNAGDAPPHSWGVAKVRHFHSSMSSSESF